MEHDNGKGRDQDEFLRLFSCHSRRIYEFILTLVTRHADADEVFQNTCLVLWKKFDAYDPEGNFYAWACRIAHLEILQLRRTNRRLQMFSEEALAVLAEEALAHADDLSARQLALEECLERLNSQDRELIEQRYYHQRAPKEIARLKARSVYSVYRALACIHSALLDCVQRKMAFEDSP